MKLNNNLPIENNFVTNANSQSFKIEIGDAEVLLSYMRKESYKFHLRTAIQEYLSNALDAHREVKQTKKCQVFAPNVDKPVLVIKDFGPGISPERMDKYFRKVGNSTKRESQRDKGGFGAGSKIGLAYTDSIIIITVVDKLKYTYHMTLTSEGSQIILIDQPRSTNEENGTEIHMPIKNDDFKKSYSAIQRFCFFSEPHETPECFNLPSEYLSTINDYTKELIGKEDDKLSSCFLVESRFLPYNSVLGTSSTNIIVLDGIPYPVDHEQESIIKQALNKLNSKYSLILKFKNGIIDPQLSREGIQNNEKNKKAISFVINSVIKAIDQEIEEKKANANNLEDHINLFLELQNKFKINELKYKDYDIKYADKFLHNIIIYNSNLEKMLTFSKVLNSKGNYIPDKKSDGKRSAFPYNNHQIFLYNPTQETIIKLNQKIRYAGDLLLEQLDKIYGRGNSYNIDKRLFLIDVTESDPEVVLSFTNDFNLKSIHDLEIPKDKIEHYKRAKGTKQKIAKTDIKINYLKHSTYNKEKFYSSHNKTVDLEFISNQDQKYIYVTIEDLKNEETHQKLQINYEFFKLLKYEFISLNKSDLKKVQENEVENFIHINHIQELYSINDLDRNGFIYKNIAHTALLDKLLVINKEYKIKNNKLFEILEEYKNICSNKTYKISVAPNFINNLYFKDTQVINKLSLFEQFDKIINDDFMLKQALKNVATSDEADLLQILNYINLKY